VYSKFKTEFDLAEVDLTQCLTTSNSTLQHKWTDL